MWHDNNTQSMHHKYKCSQHSSIIWTVWLTGCVFIYKLCGCGFESRCNHLIFRYAPVSRKEFLGIQAIRMQIYSNGVCDRIKTHCQCTIHVSSPKKAQSFGQFGLTVACFSTKSAVVGSSLDAVTFVYLLETWCIYQILKLRFRYFCLGLVCHLSNRYPCQRNVNNQLFILSCQLMTSPRICITHHTTSKKEKCPQNLARGN